MMLTAQPCSHLLHPRPQIMHAIGIMGTRLSFEMPQTLPAHASYIALAEACMATEAAERPSFEAIQLVRLAET